MQSRIFLNSIRTRRGSFELGAHVASYLLFAAVAIGPAIGMGVGSYMLTSGGHLRSLAIPLWVLTGMWQFFSALAPAIAGQNPDLSHLLRFPVSFGSWVLLYLLYGLVAPANLIGLLWTSAIGIGVILAQPSEWASVTAILILLAVFNLMLSRTILAWIERWMAQRRSREIVTAVFLAVALCAQFFNPAFHQRPNGLPYGLTRSRIAWAGQHVWQIERVLPPGLAADSILRSMSRQPAQQAKDEGALALFTIAVAALLGIRLRAESRGENLSEAPGRSATGRSRPESGNRRWLDFSGPVAAVFEKDLRYLLRSGPMLYNLASPLVMVFIFGGTAHYGRMADMRKEYALPLGLIWAFLGLTRIISNSLGAEGAGIQFYFLSPTPLRRVMLGKNALHLFLFCIEAAAIATLIVVRFGLPSPGIAAVSLAWALFAIPANLAAGNALSIAMPYRANLSRMGREPGSMGNGLLSMFVQFGVAAVGAAVIVSFAMAGFRWAAIPVLLLLAAACAIVYWRVLARVDRMIHANMESLTREVAKTA